MGYLYDDVDLDFTIKDRMMEMNYVEIVVEAIKDKGYTVTQNPYKAKLKKECDNQVFLGDYLEFGYNTSWGKVKHKVFVSNNEDRKNFHNGSFILKGTHLPSVIWFKEVNDEITIAEGLLI